MFASKPILATKRHFLTIFLICSLAEAGTVVAQTKKTQPEEQKAAQKSKAEPTAAPIILIPQKSKAQIDSITTPEPGQVIFNTTIGKAQYFDRKAWKKFTDKQHYIGELYGGGIVFYTDESREHGLIAAPEDMKDLVIWGQNDKTTGATGKAIGTGVANTEKIIAAYDSTHIAARICADFELDGYDDWYLPSIEELILVHNRIKAKGWGKFDGELYWSSSETDFNNAWIMNFKRGVSTEKNISKTMSVRAIRSF